MPRRKMGVAAAKKQVKAANRALTKSRGRLSIAKQNLCDAEKRRNRKSGR